MAVVEVDTIAAEKSIDPWTKSIDLVQEPAAA